MVGVIIRAVDLIFKIMEFALIARVLISWIPVSRDNQYIRLLYQITEPILAPIRNLLFKSFAGRNMMIDFSPIIAFILINLLRSFIMQLLIRGL